MLLGSWRFASASDAIAHGPLWMASAWTGDPAGPKHSVSGAAPDSITSVELTSTTARRSTVRPTTPASAGRPAVPDVVPDDRQVVHVDARSSDGTWSTPETWHDAPTVEPRRHQRHSAAAWSDYTLECERTGPTAQSSRSRLRAAGESAEVGGDGGGGVGGDGDHLVEHVVGVGQPGEQHLVGAGREGDAAVEHRVEERGVEPSRRSCWAAA